jgi:hypothetical protein
MPIIHHLSSINNIITPASPPPSLRLPPPQSMEANVQAMEAELQSMGRKLLRSDKRATELQMELALSEASRCVG